MIPTIGILQGRLTASIDGKLQFFPVDCWESEFEEAEKIGFKCIELLIQEDTLDKNPLWSKNGLFELNKISQKTDARILSAHGFYSKELNYTDQLKYMINQSSFIGIEVILIPFFKQNALVNEEEKRIARKQLNRVRLYCSQSNTRLGIETEMPAKELLDFILSCDNPYIGSYYDIGNMASMGVDTVKEIYTLGHRICGVHIKDRLPNGGKTTIIGKGCTDFYNTFRALKRMKYYGPYIIHGARHPEIDDIQLNTEYLKFTKELLSKIY